MSLPLGSTAMADVIGAISVSAAFVAGAAGSAHCFAMCGGLAGALGMRSRTATGGSSATAVRQACLYHFARIGGYALAGALCAAFGAALLSALDVSRLALLLRVASGVLVILVALRVLFAWNALGWLERLGARFWSKIRPLARRAASGSSAGATLLLGFLWGWLPCGLVYSMLALAALSGDALDGAAVMLAFGSGTLPAMLASSVLASRTHQWLRQRWSRLASGALLLTFGLWLTLAALQLPTHEQHRHGITPPAAR